MSTTDDQFASTNICNLVVASWTDASGKVYVAAYTNTSRCRHLWYGTPDAVESCRQTLAAEGLHIERPNESVPVGRGADVLELFADPN